MFLSRFWATSSEPKSSIQSASPVYAEFRPSTTRMSRCGALLNRCPPAHGPNDAFEKELGHSLRQAARANQRLRWRRYRVMSASGIAFSTRSAGTPPFRAISTPQCMGSSSAIECASGLMLTCSRIRATPDARRAGKPIAPTSKAPQATSST